MPGRTAAVMAAVHRQLEQRRGFLDQGDDIGQITIVVRMHLGTAVVKSVTVSDEHINKRMPYPVEAAR